MKKNKIKKNQIIENLKVIAEHINKDWDGRFSKCECGAYLIGHPKKCRGCGSSDLTYLEVTLNNNSLPKTLQIFRDADVKRCQPIQYKPQSKV